jgi:thioredoxin-like negative regulator of GroEL
LIHVLVLAAVLGAHHGSATAAKPATTLEKARAKMRSLDFEAALPLLQRALESDELAGPERAAVLIDLATKHLNLGETDEAARASPAHDAGSDVSPKGTAHRSGLSMRSASAARPAALLLRKLPVEPKP